MADNDGEFSVQSSLDSLITLIDMAGNLDFESDKRVIANALDLAVRSCKIIKKTDHKNACKARAEEDRLLAIIERQREMIEALST